MAEDFFRIRKGLTVANTTATANLDPVTLTIGTSVVNSTVVATGANVVISTTGISVGNTTVNAVANSIAIRLANSTVVLDVSKPTAAEVSSADYYLASDSTWNQIVPATGGANVFSANIGNGTNTSYVVTHNLDAIKVLIEVRENSSGYYIYPDMKYVNSNSCSIEFVSAPTTDQYLVLVVGS